MVKGHNDQVKTTGLPERHNCLWLHGVSVCVAYYILSALREIETQERNLLHYFSIIHQNAWEHWTMKDRR